MNKSALIVSVVVAAGVSKAVDLRTLDAMTALLAEKLKNREQVTLSEFAVFNVRHRMRSEEVDKKCANHVIFH